MGGRFAHESVQGDTHFEATASSACLLLCGQLAPRSSFFPKAVLRVRLATDIWFFCSMACRGCDWPHAQVPQTSLGGTADGNALARSVQLPPPIGHDARLPRPRPCEEFLQS